MAIEDKYLDEGLFSGVKKYIDDLKEFYYEYGEHIEEFDKIVNSRKNNKKRLGKEELETALETFKNIKKDANSLYLNKLLDLWIKDVEKQL